VELGEVKERLRHFSIHCASFFDLGDQNQFAEDSRFQTNLYANQKTSSFEVE
jgi:hypothetical protein